jgi:hypothetical protein
MSRIAGVASGPGERRLSPTVAYGVTTAIVVAESVVGGTMDLLRAGSFFTSLRELGYPAYFATILGVAKLLAVAALLTPGRPRLREWGYAGVVFVMAGACASQLAVGHGPDQWLPPLLFAAIALGSWALAPAPRSPRRQESRRSDANEAVR